MKQPTDEQIRILAHRIVYYQPDSMLAADAMADLRALFANQEHPQQEETKANPERMSVRLEIASRALSALYATPTTEWCGPSGDLKQDARWALEQADALIAADKETTR